MRDKKLHDLLSSLPGEDEIRNRAARARRRALNRLDEPAPIIVKQYVWWPGFAMAALVLVVAGFLYRYPVPSATPPEPLESSRAERHSDPLRMKWVLKDGTRVLWTFNKI